MNLLAVIFSPNPQLVASVITLALTPSFELVKKIASATNGKLDVAYDIPERNQGDNIVANATVRTGGGNGGAFGRGVEVTGGGIEQMMKQAGWKAGNFEG